MKFSTVAIAVLLGRPTGIFAMDTEPTSNQFTFNFNPSVSVSIRRFNDERAQAFRLVASLPGIALVTYAITSDWRLTSFRATLLGLGIIDADKRFRVSYNAQTGEIVRFTPTEIGMPTPQDLPAPFTCDECEMLTDDVCVFIVDFCSDPLDPDLVTDFLINAALPSYLCTTVKNVLCVLTSAQDVCSETCVMPVWCTILPLAGADFFKPKGVFV